MSLQQVQLDSKYHIIWFISAVGAGFIFSVWFGHMNMGILNSIQGLFDPLLVLLWVLYTKNNTTGLMNMFRSVLQLNDLGLKLPILVL